MNSQQVLALVRSHVSGDRKRFAEIATQIAHHEKRLGHAMGEQLLRMVTQGKFTRRMARDEIFDRGWLDVEDLYRISGWRVEYHKPGYNETYEPTFEFQSTLRG